MYMGASIDTAENTELVATRIMDDGSSKVFLMLGVGLGVGLVSRSKYRLVISGRYLSCFRDLKDATYNHRGQARGDYRSILKGSKTSKISA